VTRTIFPPPRLPAAAGTSPAPQAHAAEGIEITPAGIEASRRRLPPERQLFLRPDPGLEEAVQHGVSLYFTTEIELTRPRWWWFDDKAVVRRRTLRLHYDVLTRQYSVWSTAASSKPTGRRSKRRCS
jgi:hypothetical protein